MLKTIGVLIAAAAAALASPVWAQPSSTPAMPPVIRLIVPFPAGGSTDVLARTLAPQLAERLHTVVIVENRAGGSSLIGTTAVIKAPADASMLLFTTNSLVTAVATMRKIPFEIDKDLVPVAMVSEGPMVLAVNSKSSIRTPADLVAAAKKQPDVLTYGTSGFATFLHLTTEWFNEAANIKTKHVPYKGAAQAAMDVASGEVDFMVVARASIAPHVDAGRVRLIGVTSSKESAAFPGLAPMATVAPGLEVALWATVFAPAGTPASMVRLLNREINEIAKTPKLRSVMAPEGALPVELTPEQTRGRVNNDVANWRRLAVSKNLFLD